jgi:hypothetical protein
MLRDKWIESAEMGKDMANKQSGPSSRSKEPSFGEFVARHERERAALEFLFPSEAAGTNTLATALQRRPSLPPPFRELKDHPCSDCLKRRLARTAEMHTRRIYWSGCAGWVPAFREPRGRPGGARSPETAMIYEKWIEIGAPKLGRPKLGPGHPRSRFHTSA